MSKSFSLAACLESFRPAWRGLRWMVAHERNARIHLVATVVVFVVAATLRVSPADWCWLAAASAAVWMAEAFNTAIEQLADEVSREPRERIGRAKDLAAGAVLATVAGAVVIGSVVLGPRLWALLD